MSSLTYHHGRVTNIDRRVPVIRQPCGHRGRTFPELIGATAWCGACYAERGEWVQTTSIPAPPPAEPAATRTPPRPTRETRVRSLDALAELITQLDRDPTTAEWDTHARKHGLLKRSTLTPPGGTWAETCAGARDKHGLPPAETEDRDKKHQKALTVIATLTKRIGHPPTRREYDTATAETNLPKAVTVANRHGTWQAACATAAGLIRPERPPAHVTVETINPPPHRPRAKPTRRYAEGMFALATWIAEHGRNPSQHEWDTYARTAGCLSAGGLARYHGTFTDAINTARGYLDQDHAA